MFDDKTINFIGIISYYLEKINYNTSIIGFSDIEKHPEKNFNGICFSPASRANFQLSGMRYVVNVYSSFDKNISSIRETFNSLLSTQTERADAINYALQRGNNFLFIFAYMHELGHIQHIVELNLSDDIFFNPLTGINSNPSNNLIYENYADQFALKHSEEIYKLIGSNDAELESYLDDWLPR